MKSLLDFKSIIEEEKSDYSKFDALVRAGLANKAQIQRIHKILDKMGEERPNFNNADKMIIQNLFTKMVNLISNNKQINQQARRAVKEDLNEASDVVDTADFKIGPSGRKVRAHRIVFNSDVKEDTIQTESVDTPKDPPNVLVLKRKSIRMFPDNTRIALYYNNTLDKYFSVPYGPKIDSAVQAEEVQIQEAVIDTLHNIVKTRRYELVEFADGTSMKVDHSTASAITKIYGNLNEDNKKKYANMVDKSKDHFKQASDFAFRHVK